MQAAVKIDEKRHVFRNGKGARRSGVHPVGEKFWYHRDPLNGESKKSFRVAEKCIGKSEMDFGKSEKKTPHNLTYSTFGK